MEMLLARHYDTEYGLPFEALFAGAVLSMALFATCFLAWKAIVQLRAANMRSAGKRGGHLQEVAGRDWHGHHRGQR